MNYNGYSVRRNPNIGWRHAENGDTDIYGEPVSIGSVVFVSKKKCPLVERDGFEYYAAQGIPAYKKIAYVRTNGGITKPTYKQGLREFTHENREFVVNELWIHTAYFVIDGTVYSGTSHNWYAPLLLFVGEENAWEKSQESKVQAFNAHAKWPDEKILKYRHTDKEDRFSLHRSLNAVCSNILNTFVLAFTLEDGDFVTHVATRNIEGAMLIDQALRSEQK